MAETRIDRIDPQRNGSDGVRGREAEPAGTPLLTLPLEGMPPAPDEPVNILMVDDRPEQLLVLETILAGLGQNLVRASSGREALRYLLHHDCALILLDVNMPDLDGFATAALIRQRPRSRQTPIIFVTAYDEMETHISRGYSLGAVDYIQTPVVPEVLAAKASVFVDLARSIRQVRQAAERLEGRVQERTEQLQSLNQALQAEIAERERAATERDRLLTDAQEGVRRRDELLATLAHELRNPLAAIVNGAELLGAMGLANPELEETRAIIERQARHMAHLLHDLLNVSRLMRGRIELRRQFVDVRQIITDVLQAKRQEFTDSGHEPRCSLPAEPVRVHADATRLTQVIENLLANSIKFTPAGGEISIEIQVAPGQVEICVRDTGIGIPPDRLSQVFEPFVQLNQAHTRPSEGLGIGLTLVRRIVELHGGSVYASSAGRGRGSQFTVTLPREPAEMEVDPTSAARNGRTPRRQAAPRSIVLVEDNSDARRLLSRLLSCDGHRVEETDDGPSGLEAIRRIRPDVAFVDIGLPGMDGYQIAAQVRSDPGCRRVRLIAMTGYGQPEDCRRALDAGFDAHLIKPVRADDLARILDAQPAAV